MAVKNFILQGFTSKTHADAINRLLDTPDIKRVILSVAYLKEDGVNLIEDKLRIVANKAIIFSGIRNDITSRQGLAKLMSIGVSVYVVDTGARHVIFHPKLYLARGKNLARLVIGSANLTRGGLNNNIEAGLTLDLDLNNSSDRQLVNEIEKQFLDLPTRDPEHIWLIKSTEELEDLQISGRLLDETEALPPRPIYTNNTPAKDTISRIKLNAKFLYSTIRRTKLKLRRKKLVQSQVSTNLELVWQNTSLTERDLNIPTARGTHRTGSINLDKGSLDKEIDHRHYFRNEVFSNLNWSPRTTQKIEETEARFQLEIKGIYYGEFILPIRHSTDTSSESYKQHNAMTRLSWGVMREYIAQRNFIGRTLSLYRDETDTSKFLLEID